MCFYRFENKSARILHISLGDGQTLAIPPTEGGVTHEVSDAAKPLFQANIATPAVQAWIDDGQLTITEIEETPPDPPPEGEGTRRTGLPGVPDAPAPDAPDAPSPPEAYTPARGRRGRYGE